MHLTFPADKVRALCAALPDEPSFGDLVGLLLLAPLGIPEARQVDLVQNLLRQFAAALHTDKGETPLSKETFLQCQAIREGFGTAAPQMAEQLRKRLMRYERDREQTRMYRRMLEDERQAHARTLAERDYWRAQARQVIAARESRKKPLTHEVAR